MACGGLKSPEIRQQWISTLSLTRVSQVKPWQNERKLNRDGGI
jgi:hypothetical protein